MSALARGRLASLAALVVGFFVAGCEGKSGVTATTDAGPTRLVPAGSARTAPPPSARPDVREPRLTWLSRRPSSVVDVAPGHPPNADHPAGTVFVAAVLENEVHRGEATLFEWDVASAQPLRPDGELLYRESDKEENGKSENVRIVATSNAVYSAVTLAHGRFTVLKKNGYIAQASSRPQFVTPARNLSLEADDRFLAMAYERVSYSEDPEYPRVGVLLFDAWTMQRVGTYALSAPLAGSPAASLGLRFDILEIVDGRLYAAEAQFAKLHVVELSMPGLKPVHETNVSMPDGFGGGVQLTQIRGHLVALTHDQLVELTPDLEVVSKRELHAGEVALGPAGELLTPLGIEGAGHRGDFVADAHASASCTPSWMGAYPLLACAVDLDGIRIARLAPR
jgi:hypothetical protein